MVCCSLKMPTTRYLDWLASSYPMATFVPYYQQCQVLDPTSHPLPNLASKILSLNLKRLSKDWENMHGHPVLLAETFVDTSRFAGTCYKAANWIYLGQTRGFGKSSNCYFHHGQKKAIFVHPLNKRALRWLTGIKNIAEALRNMAAEPHLALRLIGI